MKTTHDTGERDVLHAFSIEPNRDAEILAVYVEQYPQYREALIDLSIELLTAPNLDEKPPKIVSSDSAGRAWSRFQSLLSPADPAFATKNFAINPLLDLSDQRFREIAKELNVTRLFLTRLRDSVIQASTLPERLVSQVAQLVGVGVDTLNTALHASPSMPTGQRFKSDGKPSAGKQMTFDEAIENSGLSEEQKSALKAMKG
ncbi:MAG: hypothetical protein GXP08_00910 [Gammaproteobacteria bacterium]|nr:hypothetical protein [Gammaproteobacteria bacterium]